ncbi:MAG: hypothetical protein JNJ46_26465 [Myxococcales bacterium]|nr:hypothetical protein [Myxococcales bacterium]
MKLDPPAFEELSQGVQRLRKRAVQPGFKPADGFDMDSGSSGDISLRWPQKTTSRKELLGGNAHFY